MNRPNVLLSMMLFFVSLGVCFLLLYIFDTFVFESMFEQDLIVNNVPPILYKLLSYIFVFGIPIAIFFMSLRWGIEGGTGL